MKFRINFAKFFTISIVSFTLFTSIGTAHAVDVSRENSQPNVIFVFCDDLGFGDPAIPNHFVPDETLADAPYILHLLSGPIYKSFSKNRLKSFLPAVTAIISINCSVK